jgi:hypothetical protein
MCCVIPEEKPATMDENDMELVSMKQAPPDHCEYRMEHLVALSHV